MYPLLLLKLAGVEVGIGILLFLAYKKYVVKTQPNKKLVKIGLTITILGILANIIIMT